MKVVAVLRHMLAPRERGHMTTDSDDYASSMAGNLTEAASRIADFACYEHSRSPD